MPTLPLEAVTTKAGCPSYLYTFQKLESVFVVALKFPKESIPKYPFDEN